MPRPQRLLVLVLIALAPALLASCGSSGKGLIPETNAGPLRSDFEAVAQAAESGNGSCASTEQALGKTERDFLALPASVDAALRKRLRQGISNLHSRALSACAEPSATATGTTSTQTTSTTTQTPTTSTNTTTQPPTQTPSTPTSEHGGGTPAEESAGEPGEGKGKGRGEGEGKGVGKETGGEDEANSGGTSAGGGH